MSVERDPNLVGLWITDPIDLISLNLMGNVRMDFRADGTLIYTLQRGNHDQIMRLQWSTREGTLLTDQPSSPRLEETPYGLTSEGILILRYGEQEFRYLRAIPNLG